MKIEVPKETFEHKVGMSFIGYNSAPEMPRMISGFLNNVDLIIGGDGKFDFYPGKSDYSEDGMLDIAEKLCKESGTEFIGYQLAGRQVDKRQRYLDIAGREKCDFLICIDTDDYIMPEYSDWNRFYFELFSLSNIVKDRVFYKWVWIPNTKLWPKQGNQFPSNVWRKSVRVHKDPGTMRYCMDSHFIWCPKDKTDAQLLKWQLKNRGEVNPWQFQPAIVIDGVRDTMDRTLRTKQQIKAGKKWAFLNQHAENSRSFYKVMKIRGNAPPMGFKSWKEWENKPHTFDPKDGHRIELDE